MAIGSIVDFAADMPIFAELFAICDIGAGQIWGN
jgi:hypothetical protein